MLLPSSQIFSTLHNSNFNTPTRIPFQISHVMTSFPPWRTISQIQITININPLTMPARWSNISPTIWRN
jgi:hypothetical protein